MVSADPPTGDHIGKDHHEGNNPTPGGDIDTGRSEVPPYDGRSAGADGESEGTARAFGSKEPLREPLHPGSDVPDDDAAMAPEGVGESVTRRGEDVIEGEGKEPGRVDTGTDDSVAGRPTGESTPRDETGVDEQEEGGH